MATETAQGAGIFPEYPCACYDDPTQCVCGTQERALRNVIAGKAPPMTAEQRAWCREEITRVEGYDETDAEGDDERVARTVLSAWTDFCRDKGLL